MKIKIEIDENLTEEEIIIKTPVINQTISQIQARLSEISQKQERIIFYKGEVEYYLPIQSILFFETEGKGVQAHTRTDIYNIKYKLYELEHLLPYTFMRVSKSTIVNVSKIYAISKSLSSPCIIQFEKTHKEIYVSRHYYKSLRLKLEEKR